ADTEFVAHEFSTGVLSAGDKQLFDRWVGDVWRKEIDSQMAVTTRQIDQRVIHAIDTAHYILAMSEKSDPRTLALVRAEYASSRAKLGWWDWKLPYRMTAR
ncbi:MAG: hypothetical protein O3C57_06295, partial [Verrucomicrobia bacterium]|nr:hypothetical protein [Verrucomicrobiota bacterium]